MSDILRIALRNVLRQPRRTCLTGAAVAFAVVAMAVASGFVEFSLWGLRQSVVYGGLGHLQIRAASLERTRLEPSIIARLQTELTTSGEVEYHAARLEFQGLVSSAGATVAASGLGVEVPTESMIRMLMSMRAGDWFTGKEHMPRAVVGQGLARRLQVKPRDVVSVIAFSDRGSMTAIDVQVAGVFESGVVEYDDRTFLVSLAAAQDLMETSGISSIAVTVRDDAIDLLASRLARAVGASGHVATWRELSPIYDRVVAMYEWILRALLFIVGIVVTLGIANTMSMAVLERVAEVGVLRALGFGASRIVVMFILEAASIGVCGVVTGWLLAGMACHALTWAGIEMPPPPGYSQGYLVEVPIVPRAFAGAGLMATLVAILAAVGPSIRATRGEVADALRGG